MLLPNCIKVVEIRNALIITDSIIIFEITFFEITSPASKIKIDNMVEVVAIYIIILLIWAIAIYTMSAFASIFYVGISKNKICRKLA